MNTVCPTCGHHMMADHAPIDALSSAPMSRTERTIVAVLAEAYPGDVHPAEISKRLYTDGDSLKVQISQLRKKLRPFGWTIPTNNSGRGHYSSYRLKLLTEDRRR